MAISSVTGLLQGYGGPSLDDGLGGGCGTVVGLALAGWYYAWRDGRATKKWKAEHAAWEGPAAKWAGLYYCFRDDCVFDPAGGVAVPPERMNELLRG
jgi:hypothetical protein